MASEAQAPAPVAGAAVEAEAAEAVVEDEAVPVAEGEDRIHVAPTTGSTQASATVAGLSLLITDRCR